jgi:hypothetical protein
MRHRKGLEEMARLANVQLSEEDLYESWCRARDLLRVGLNGPYACPEARLAWSELADISAASMRLA